MFVLATAIIIYIAIGIFVTCEVFVVARDIKEDNNNYADAQQVVENLVGFVGFSYSLLKWPRLMYIIYFGGR